MTKSIRLEQDKYEDFKNSAKQCGITLKEYVTLCCAHYSTRNINPKKQVSLEELRNVFVSFTREQEKKYHNRTLKKVNYIANELGKIELVLNNISFDIKVVKTRK